MRLFLLALLVGSLPAFAQPPTDSRSEWRQTAKGVRLLGGGATITRSDQNTFVSVSPRAGAFISDRLALSTSVGFSYSRSTFDQSGGTSATFSALSASIGPTVTYYFSDSPDARPFVEGDVSVSYTRSVREGTSIFDGGNSSSDVGVGGGVSAGVEIPIARNVALRGAAFYRANDLTFENNIDVYGLAAGFTTFIY